MIEPDEELETDIAGKSRFERVLDKGLAILVIVAFVSILVTIIVFCFRIILGPL